MLCSIIVPVYNCPTHILLRNIKELTDLNPAYFEVIIIDDGSKYSVEKLLSEEGYTDSTVLKIITQNNKGVSAARNKGIQEASGKWICFCDADDEIDSSVLEKNIHSLKDYDFVYCDYLKKKGENEDYIVLNDCFSIDEYQKEILCEPNLYGTVWGKLFRTDIIRKRELLFDTDLSHSEDTIFLIRYVLEAKSIIKTECFYKYYINYTSAAKLDHNAIDNFINSMLRCDEMMTNNKYKRYVSNYCCINLLIIIVNYIFVDNISFKMACSTLNEVLAVEIINYSLNHYIEKEMNIINRLILLLVKMKQYSLLYLIVVMRKHI